MELQTGSLRLTSITDELMELEPQSLKLNNNTALIIKNLDALKQEIDDIVNAINTSKASFHISDQHYEKLKLKNQEINQKLKDLTMVICLFFSTLPIILYTFNF